jgi:hypothetical protein
LIYRCRQPAPGRPRLIVGSACSVADADPVRKDRRDLVGHQAMRIRLAVGLIILLLAPVLAACTGVAVTPNRTNPAFVGTYGPGGSGWR